MKMMPMQTSTTSMTTYETASASFETYLAALRANLAEREPELLAEFDIYAGEAQFGRQWLHAELQQLAPGSIILEVGAGMFLLACQLQREGFAVTALEPVGSGFAHFHRLQQLVLEYAKQHQVIPEIFPYPAEELTQENRFVFAYSLNVMEHVTDVQKVLERVSAALRRGSRYRFVCPNYAFPFETHFRVPIIINKNITLMIFKNTILHTPNLVDPQAGWDSLNWITVTKIRCICKKLRISASFNPTILNFYVDRALKEPSFCARHPFIHRLICAMRMVGLLQMVRFITMQWTPVIDCTITKN